MNQLRQATCRRGHLWHLLAIKGFVAQDPKYDYVKASISILSLVSFLIFSHALNLSKYLANIIKIRSTKHLSMSSTQNSDLAFLASMLEFYISL
jgi:hypothetical protein